MKTTSEKKLSIGFLRSCLWELPLSFSLEQDMSKLVVTCESLFLGDREARYPIVQEIGHVTFNYSSGVLV